MVTRRVTPATTTAQQTLAGLMTLETAATTSNSANGGTSGTRAVDNAWRGAEAYHFFIMSLNLLYRGDMHFAMECARELQQYDDILDSQRVYSILAITSYKSGYYATCSSAFVKLESLESASSSMRKKYEELALKIFAAKEPRDPARAASRVHKNGRYGRQRLCIASGIPLNDRSAEGRVVTCRRCRHSAFMEKLEDYRFCPLCHGPKKGFR